MEVPSTFYIYCAKGYPASIYPLEDQSWIPPVLICITFPVNTLIQFLAGPSYVWLLSLLSCSF